MKVKIRATSGDNNYPTICGDHDFDTLDQACDFAINGAKGLNRDDVCELVINFEPSRYNLYQGYDYVIEIYDTWRE